MKIIYISDQTPFNNTFIKQDVHIMAQEYDVHYIAFNKDEDYPSKNYKSVLVPYPTQSLKSKLLWRLEKADIYLNWYDKKFSKSLKDTLKRINPDIIHCQFAYEGIKYFDNINDSKTPIVLNFRGYDASYKLRLKTYVRKIKKIVTQKNVHCVFVCKALLKMLESKNISFANKPHILYTGINTKKFYRKNYQKKDPTLIQVGAFNDKKGQLISVKAFQKFIKNTNNQTARMVFIGQGKNFEKVKTFVRSNGLRERVILLGKKSHDEIIKHLDDSTHFFHHSIIPENGDMEGIPNAIIEAMCMELPILSTYHSGIPEAVENNFNGLLCQENDIEKYALNMQEILEMGYLKINREKVIHQFNIDNHITQLKKIYSSIV